MSAYRRCSSAASRLVSGGRSGSWTAPECAERFMFLPNDRTQAQPPARGDDCRWACAHPFASPRPNARAGWLVPGVNSQPCSCLRVDSSARCLHQHPRHQRIPPIARKGKEHNIAIKYVSGSDKSTGTSLRRGKKLPINTPNPKNKTMLPAAAYTIRAIRYLWRRVADIDQLTDGGPP
jgi:hypothetical protein